MNEKYLLQLKTALRVYLERGQKLIEALNGSQDDEVLFSLTRSRKASFLNYQVADALSGELSAKFYQSDDGQSLLTQMLSQEALLLEAYENESQKLEISMVKLKQEREKITKFRSKEFREGTFKVSI